jgi:hypothetical protein
MIGLKLGRPRWFDATALCIGSMTPDLLYTVSAYLRFDTHRGFAAFAYGIPAAMVLAITTRRFLAPVGALHLPDLGPFRLRSYAVLAARRPALVLTAVSSFLGVGSHIVLDWFTHPGRPGVRWLGYDDVSVTLFGVTEPLAGVFQLFGHSFGSLGGVALLWIVGRRELLADWYGAATVSQARTWTPTTRQRCAFWASIAAGLLVGILWGVRGGKLELIQRTFVGALAGAFGAAIAQRRSGERAAA